MEFGEWAMVIHVDLFQDGPKIPLEKKDYTHPFGDLAAQFKLR